MTTTYQLSRVIALTYLIIFSQPSIADSIPTIDGLVSPYYSEKYIECHDDTAEAYAQSSHSMSVTSPAVVSMLKEIIIKSPKTDQAETVKACLSCHALRSTMQQTSRLMQQLN